MSREVDLSTPLTREEYSYLTERSRGDLIERAHAMHGTSDDDYADLAYGDGTGLREQPLLTGEARASRRDQLLAELAALDEAEGVSDEDEDVEDTRPYAERTSAELDEELQARGLPTGGNKAEKVKRLEADDAAA